MIITFNLHQGKSKEIKQLGLFKNMMPGALKSHKQPRDETRRVNGARSSWKDLNQFKDTSDTYGVHICTRDDPLYKDYISTAWTQQKNSSPSNCKCLTM